MDIRAAGPIRESYLFAGSRAISRAAVQGAILSTIPAGAAYVVTKNWRFAVLIVGLRTAGILALGILVLPILIRIVKHCVPSLRGNTNPVTTQAIATDPVPGQVKVGGSQERAATSSGIVSEESPQERRSPARPDPAANEKPGELGSSAPSNYVKTLLLSQSVLASANELTPPPAITDIPNKPEATLGGTLKFVQEEHVVEAELKQRKSLGEEEGQNETWRNQHLQFKALRTAFNGGTSWQKTVEEMAKLIDQGFIPRTRGNHQYRLLLTTPTQTAKAGQLEAQQSEAETKSQKASNGQNVLALYKGGLNFLNRVAQAQQPGTKVALHQAACDWLKAAMESGIKQAIGAYGYARVMGASAEDPKEFLAALQEEAKIGEDKEGWAALAIGLHALKPKQGIVDYPSALEFLKKAVEKKNPRAEEEYKKVQEEAIAYQRYDEILKEMQSKITDEDLNVVIIKLAEFLKKGFLPPHTDKQALTALKNRTVTCKVLFQKHWEKVLKIPLKQEEEARLKESITIFCEALYVVGAQFHDNAQQLMKEGKEKQARELFGIAAEWLDVPSTTRVRTVNENPLKKSILFARCVAERNCKVIDQLQRDIYAQRVADAENWDQNVDNDKNEYLDSPEWQLFWYTIKEKWHLEGPHKNLGKAAEFVKKRLDLQEQLEAAQADEPNEESAEPGQGS